MPQPLSTSSSATSQASSTPAASERSGRGASGRGPYSSPIKRAWRAMAARSPSRQHHHLTWAPGRRPQGATCCPNRSARCRWEQQRYAAASGASSHGASGVGREAPHAAEPAQLQHVGRPATSSDVPAAHARLDPPDRVAGGPPRGGGGGQQPVLVKLKASVMVKAQIRGQSLKRDHALRAGAAEPPFEHPWIQRAHPACRNMHQGRMRPSAAGPCTLAPDGVAGLVLRHVPGAGPHIRPVQLRVPVIQVDAAVARVGRCKVELRVPGCASKAAGGEPVSARGVAAPIAAGPGLGCKWACAGAQMQRAPCTEAPAGGSTEGPPRRHSLDRTQSPAPQARPMACPLFWTDTWSRQP